MTGDACMHRSTIAFNCVRTHSALTTLCLFISSRRMSIAYLIWSCRSISLPRLLAVDAGMPARFAAAVG